MLLFKNLDVFVLQVLLLVGDKSVEFSVSVGLAGSLGEVSVGGERALNHLVHVLLGLHASDSSLFVGEEDLFSL